MARLYYYSGVLCPIAWLLGLSGMKLILISKKRDSSAGVEKDDLAIAAAPLEPISGFVSPFFVSALAVASGELPRRSWLPLRSCECPGSGESRLLASWKNSPRM